MKRSSNDRIPIELKEKAERIREKEQEKTRKVIHRTDVYRMLAKITDEDIWEKLKKRKLKF